MDFETWRDRELERRIRDEADDRVERLAPPEAFPDEYRAGAKSAGAHRDRGANAAAVDAVLTPGCCGWMKPPRAPELYDAMRSENPTERHQAVASAFVKEAHIDDIVMANLQGAFTWRQLATMLHRLGMATSGLSPYVNRWARQDRQQDRDPR